MVGSTATKGTVAVLEGRVEETELWACREICQRGSSVNILGRHSKWTPHKALTPSIGLPGQWFPPPPVCGVEELETCLSSLRCCVTKDTPFYLCCSVCSSPGDRLREGPGGHERSHRTVSAPRDPGVGTRGSSKARVGSGRGRALGPGPEESPRDSHTESGTVAPPATGPRGPGRHADLGAWPYKAS